MAADNELLEQFKREVSVTWEDPDTNTRLETVLSSAVATMAHQLGLPDTYDFAAAGMENTLVLGYAAYIWNGTPLSDFYSRYKQTILMTREKHEVARRQVI